MNITVFIQMAVERGAVHGDIGMRFVHRFHAFGRGPEHQHALMLRQP